MLHSGGHSEIAPSSQAKRLVRNLNWTTSLPCPIQLLSLLPSPSFVRSCFPVVSGDNLRAPHRISSCSLPFNPTPSRDVAQIRRQAYEKSKTLTGHTCQGVTIGHIHTLPIPKAPKHEGCVHLTLFSGSLVEWARVRGQARLGWSQEPKEADARMLFRQMFGLPFSVFLLIKF